MHEEQNTHEEITTSCDPVSPDRNALFEQLNPRDIEQFYQGYRLWTVQRRINQLHAQIAELQQQRSQNIERMQRAQPSPIALSVLAQLQAHGVEDVELLDHMLERGEEWLDHMMDLLVRCERLDMIQGDYTRWCEHVLEEAYDWLASMTNAQVNSKATAPDETATEETAELLLHKLMSEDEAQAEEASGTTSSTEAEPSNEQTNAADEAGPSPLSEGIEFSIIEEQSAAEAAEAGQELSTVIKDTVPEEQHAPEDTSREPSVGLQASTQEEQEPATSSGAEDQLEEQGQEETTQEISNGHTASNTWHAEKLAQLSKDDHELPPVNDQRSQPGTPTLKAASTEKLVPTAPSTTSTKKAQRALFDLFKGWRRN